MMIADCYNISILKGSNKQAIREAVQEGLLSAGVLKAKCPSEPDGKAQVCAALTIQRVFIVMF